LRLKKDKKKKTETDRQTENHT